jgi:hypothetical protein
MKKITIIVPILLAIFISATLYNSNGDKIGEGKTPSPLSTLVYESNPLKDYLAPTDLHAATTTYPGYGPELTINGVTKTMIKYPDDFNHCNKAQQTANIAVFDCGAFVIVATVGSSTMLCGSGAHEVFTITDTTLRPPTRMGSGGFSHQDLVGVSVAVETDGKFKCYRTSTDHYVYNTRITPLVYPKNGYGKSWPQKITIGGVQKTNIISSDIIGGASRAAVSSQTGATAGYAYDWGGMVALSYMSADCGTIPAGSSKVCFSVPEKFRPTHTVGAIAYCHNLRGTNEPWGVSVNIHTNGNIEYYNASEATPGGDTSQATLKCDNTHLSVMYTNVTGNINWPGINLKLNDDTKMVMQASTWGTSAKSTSWGVSEKQFQVMAQNLESANWESSAEPWAGIYLGRFPWPHLNAITVPILCHYNFHGYNPYSSYFVSANITADGDVSGYDTTTWWGAHQNCRIPFVAPGLNI